MLAGCVREPLHPQESRLCCVREHECGVHDESANVTTHTPHPTNLPLDLSPLPCRPSALFTPVHDDSAAAQPMFSLRATSKVRVRVRLCVERMEDGRNHFSVTLHHVVSAPQNLSLPCSPHLHSNTTTRVSCALAGAREASRESAAWRGAVGRRQG
jgi:hypothetical protein